MSRSIDELCQIAQSASGTTRVAWSPEEAVALIERMIAAERMAGAALLHAETSVSAAKDAIGVLGRISCTAPDWVVDYVARYYPGKDYKALWRHDP